MKRSKRFWMAEIVFILFMALPVGVGVCPETKAAEKVKEGAEKILKTGEKATQEAGEKLKELDKKSPEPAKEKAAPSK